MNCSDQDACWDGLVCRNGMCVEACWKDSDCAGTGMDCQLSLNGSWGACSQKALVSNNIPPYPLIIGLSVTAFLLLVIAVLLVLRRRNKRKSVIVVAEEMQGVSKVDSENDDADEANDADLPRYENVIYQEKEK